MSSTVPSVSAAILEERRQYYIDQYVRENTKTGELIAKNSPTLPGGTTRAVLVHEPFPLAFTGGRDCYVTSTDGHEYLDFVSEYCAGMLGHSHPDIQAAIQKVASEGFTLGGANQYEGELARRLCERFASMDGIRFANSGTEANTLAIATALAYTGREKVLVFENGYHGGTLAFSSPGPLTLPHQFIYGNFNDIERTKSKIDIEIGVIVVEPLQFAGGLITGNKDFLQFLRDEATRIGAVLLFDEVVTSRLLFGGMQSHFGITPDMTTIGKHFGGGFSFGAFGGKRDIMDLFNPRSPRCIYHSGTWNNNSFSMAAGIVATKLLSPEALDRTSALGDQLRTRIGEIFESASPGLVKMYGWGSVVGVRFQGPQADKLRELYYFFLLSQRIYSGFRGFLALNITHSQEHVDQLISAVELFCSEVLPRMEPVARL
ncbi:hypothetical protein VTL71DRAFT_14042 [Oculimacula yallundae]|uniref:Aminotransferase class-III n=1 Tax=Oculimacula yallundae TaxID=86028 RepID=A0ABR4CNP5_9HELO